MLSACSYVYADKFTACVQNVRLSNSCIHRNVSCVHIRRSARPSGCPSEFQNSAAQSCFFCRAGGENKQCLLPQRRSYCQSLADIREWVVFQQDSAPAHRARETIELLRRETCQTLFHRNSGHRKVHIITRWITKSGLQCSSVSIKIRNNDELRQCLLNVWSSIEQDVIDASIDQWRVWLEACVCSGGGHFEHML